MLEKTKTLLIDDHPLIRRGIKQLLELDNEFQIIGDTGNGKEGINIALETNPDLIILDLNMKELSGLDTLKILREKEVDSKIAILTVSDSKNDIFSLIDAGADGYLLKDSDPDLLLNQIKQISKGEIIFSDAVKESILERQSGKNPIYTLTDREMDVLSQIATGLSNKQIASKLFISEETVKVHIRNLLRKLNVHSRVAATILYLQYNNSSIT